MSGTEAQEYAHDDKPVHCQFCGEKELAHQKTIEIRASYEALLRIVG